jgi:hypothetical protein
MFLAKLARKSTFFRSLFSAGNGGFSHTLDRVKAYGAVTVSTNCGEVGGVVINEPVLETDTTVIV